MCSQSRCARAVDDAAPLEPGIRRVNVTAALHLCLIRFIKLRRRLLMPVARRAVPP